MSWSRSISLRAATLCAACFLAALAPPPRSHAAGTGCETFAWPVDAERQAFSSPDIDKVRSGAALGSWSERAFDLTLQPVKDVAFAIPPGGKPKGEPKEAFGGLVTFGAPAEAGLYQVTLSGEGWIDVIQDGKELPAAAHTGAKECPGLRKSVRFEIGAAPVVLQLSGSGTETIKVSLRRAN
jgi:hypothetical protein